MRTRLLAQRIDGARVVGIRIQVPANQIGVAYSGGHQNIRLRSAPDQIAHHVGLRLHQVLRGGRFMIDIDGIDIGAPIE